MFIFKNERSSSIMESIRPKREMGSETSEESYIRVFLSTVYEKTVQICVYNLLYRCNYLLKYVQKKCVELAHSDWKF